MTSPLSPEAVAQMVADLATKSAMINMGEKIAWGSDSGVMDAAADMLTTLAAENATLQRDYDRATVTAAQFMADAVQRLETAERANATLRASEAAAMERVKVLEEALMIYADSCDETETKSCGYDGNMCCRSARAALTPTADKEPKT